ncbi:MAG: putative small conductance mechanosensitive ion [Ramlibacter sp.]|jgi:small-conductance mechanosensitive channel|nr:putative small conductance mechanosensitive ion [Ramlibacter sp.]
MQQLRATLAENPWLATLAVALTAVVFALLFHHVVGGLLRRHSERTPIVHSVLMAVEKPAGAVVPLLALQLVWQAAPDNLPQMGAVRHVNGVLLIAALTWLAMAVINGLANGVIARHPLTMSDNLQARRIQTQAKVFARSAMVLVTIAGAAMALMTFPGARQLGASLLASAGVIGIVGGIAARPVFSNLIAGLQLALAQPLRLDDVLIVKGEFGRVEEITGTYVVLKLWDERRMVVPLQWFIENPFENWTRTGSQLLQSVFLYLDFKTPMEPLRAELQRLVEAAPEWDKRVANLMVVDTSERTMKVRALLSAQASGSAFDLGCKVREGLLAFLVREYPDALPRVRLETAALEGAALSPVAPRDTGPGSGPTA